MPLPASQKLLADVGTEQGEDALELAEFFQAQHPVDLMAAQWLAQQEEGLDQEQEQAFHAWLAEDPRHQHAYDVLVALMGKVTELPVPVPHAVMRPQEDARRRGADNNTLFTRAAQLVWRRGTAYAMLLVLVCASGGYAWQDKEVFASTYTTARSEHKEITLPDDSALTLDTQTTVAVSFTEKKRVVDLPEGQVFFRVASKDNMPFEVVTGQARITVVGTRFSVRHTKDGMYPGQTHLAVEEGHVRIVKKSWWPWTTTLDLHAGDTVAMTQDGQLGNITHTAYPAPALLWRQGRVNFSNVTLAQALSEFERYSDTKVTLRDPAVAQMRIQGSFDLQRLDAFIRAVPQVLPVYPVQQGDDTTFIRAGETSLK